MKVYCLKTGSKQLKRGGESYAGVACQEKDVSVLCARGLFDGKPYPREWPAVELYLRNGKKQKPDIYMFGGYALVFPDKVKKLIEVALDEVGELFPVTIKGDKSRYYFLNVTNSMNVLDQKRSKWWCSGGKKGYKTLEEPAFRPDLFGRQSIFKIPDDGGAAIYCLERSSPDGMGFKEIVEKHGLTGLQFDLVWQA